MSDTIRAAAAQFHVGADVESNLRKCLEALDQASSCKPDVIVLPEFCNHLSWYDDIDHCREVSVAIDGTFLKAIGEKARELNCWVTTNVTLQRGPTARATGTSILFDRQGKIRGENTKQIYIGHENDFLDKAHEPGPIIDDELGKAGMYACMDGVIMETPRALALRGAEVLLNSLNSFASDEGSLHIPVRAAENKIFVVAANKVGPLVPEAMVEGISQATGIPARFLSGAGESQIVAPNGDVIAKASLEVEEFIFADFDPRDAQNKIRPDGTDVFASRRPELYAPLAANPETQQDVSFKGANEVLAALANGIESVRSAHQKGARLVAIPPIAGLDERSVGEALALSQKALQQLKDICSQTGGYAGTSLVLDRKSEAMHCAVLVGPNGIELIQPQIHSSKRTQWSVLGDAIITADLPFGRIAMATSDDTIYPEHFRLLALAGAEIVIAPVAPLEGWELRTGLIERAAENRVNLLAPCKPSPLGRGLAACLQTDFTLLTEWNERPFDGLLSQPELIWMSDEPVTLARLRPANAANKIVSRGTDLLAGRPWNLIESIVQA